LLGKGDPRRLGLLDVDVVELGTELGDGDATIDGR